MQIHEAKINDKGIETLFRYADKPHRMGADDSKKSQRYIPGINIPDVEGLTEPFSVPIVGDEEPVSLTIDWPRDITQNNLLERVTFTGVIPAETVLEGSVAKEPAIVDIEDFDRSNPTDDIFSEFSAVGGLLRVVAQKTAGTTPFDEPTYSGMATFAIYENMEEMQMFVHAFATGEISAADAFNIVVDYPKLTQKLGAQSLLPPTIQ